MFKRHLEQTLIAWKAKEHRKPLVLRGARQTGKTTLIRAFSGHFGNLVELNLEKDSLRRIFSAVRDAHDVIRSVEGVVNQRIVPGETLFFIDEIQNSVEAIKLLRFFYEELPQLHVIAAGSLLEVRMRDEGWSFPVGRVEFAYLYPATFEEFLGAIGENILLEAMRGLRVDKPLPAPLHDKLGNLLSLYMTIGGMPEAVSRYMETKSLTEVREVHEALFAAFSEDFGKYSRRSEVEYLRLLWEKIPFQLGQRIAYSRLSEQKARSRDISNAFSILHEAMLVERIWPTTRTKMPLVRKPKSAPKALYVDIGLCSHVAGVTLEQLSKRLADPLYDGGLAESFVGQEFMAANDSCRITPFFWIREEKNTSSELDYLLQMGDRLVPVEVKLRSHGALKSLHQYLARSKTNLGVRVYGGELKYEKHRVALPDGTGLNYRLLSVPFYAAGRLKDFLEDLWDEEP